MIGVGSSQCEHSPISGLKELAGQEVGVHSEQAAVSVPDQRGLLEVLRGRHQLRLGGGQAGGQRQQEQGGDGGELEC